MKLLNATSGRSVFSAALCGLLSLSALAVAAEQAPAATALATERQSPPPPLPPRPLKLPQPLKYTMPNGLTVLLLEDHRVPFVTLDLGIKCGDCQDPKDIPGLASIAASMVTDGTPQYTSKQIASTVDSIGGTLRGWADADFSMVAGGVLSKNQDKLVDMLSDVVRHPSYPEDELKLARSNLLEELRMKRSNPSFLAEERFSKVVYGDHPYSVVSATPESVQRMQRSALSQFAKVHYLPNASTLVVVGDFQTDKMQDLLKKDFGDWQSAPRSAAVQAKTPQRSGSTIYLIDRPGSVQSSLRMGNLALKKTDPDYFAALVANQVLGGSPMSRLFLNIREKKGYTYGAYSGFITHIQPGTFNASAEVRTPVTAPALKEFLYELNRIRTTSATEQEMKAAKSYLVGTFQSGFETQSNIAQKLMECQLYDLPKNYLFSYTDKVLAITPADVQRIAQKYIDLNNLAIVVVGDSKKIESELRTFDPIEVYDQDGKLLRSDSKT